MDKKRLKKLMTSVAKGEVTMEQANELIKPKIMQNQSVETNVGTPEKEAGCKEIAPINSKKGKAQRDAARDKLSKEAEEDTQTRKLNPMGG